MQQTNISYRSHIYRKHRDLLSLVSEEGQACDNKHSNLEENIEDFHSFEGEYSTDVMDITNCREQNLKRNLCFVH